MSENIVTNSHTARYRSYCRRSYSMSCTWYLDPILGLDSYFLIHAATFRSAPRQGGLAFAG